MSSPVKRDPLRDLLEPLPPERGGRDRAPLVLHSCCCCCCCCLHTVGGAIGAVLGGIHQAEPDPMSLRRRPPLSSQAMYWLSFLIVTGISWIGISGYYLLGEWNMGLRGSQNMFDIDWLFQHLGQSVMIYGFVVLMLGPLWLLAASLVMAIWLACWPGVRERADYWKSLGWITLYSLLGTGLGILLMVGVCVGFGGLR